MSCSRCLLTLLIQLHCTELYQLGCNACIMHPCPSLPLPRKQGLPDLCSLRVPPPKFSHPDYTKRCQLAPAPLTTSVSFSFPPLGSKKHFVLHSTCDNSWCSSDNSFNTARLSWRQLLHAPPPPPLSPLSPPSSLHLHHTLLTFTPLTPLWAPNPIVQRSTPVMLLL